MKTIAVDVGNTSTAVGLCSGGRVSGVGHYDGRGTAAMKAVASIAAKSGAKAIAYVSVVPEADAGWRRFARGLGLSVHSVSHRDFHLVADIVRFRYPRPETIGADRIADAVGAASRYGAPTIVLDFGTALTAAAITSDRVWRGGAIAPGYPLMGDYLFERTAKLPRMEFRGGRAPRIGRSTEEAMRFGAIVGYRGMVREIAGELARNLGGDFRLVATGGFAKTALSGIGMPFTLDSTLTLHGAGLICERSLQTGRSVR